MMGSVTYLEVIAGSHKLILRNEVAGPGFDTHFATPEMRCLEFESLKSSVNSSVNIVSRTGSEFDDNAPPRRRIKNARAIFGRCARDTLELRDGAARVRLRIAVGSRQDLRPGEGPFASSGAPHRPRHVT